MLAIGHYRLLWGCGVQQRQLVMTAGEPECSIIFECLFRGRDPDYWFWITA
jgi:hypothetical protein